MTGESGRRLVLFAKEPEAGRVKTRLARTIGAEAAAALYESFLVDLSAALPGDWEMVLAHDGDGGPRLRKIFSEGWTREPQGDGTLGERMARAIARAFAGDSSSKVVLAGSDAPTLTAEGIAAAFEALDTSDIVFAPSPDGGYSLVGVKNNKASTIGDSSKVFLEEIRWSTAYALEDSEAAAQRFGMRIGRVAAVPDVDVEEDLETLRTALAANAAIAPATRLAIEHAPGPALLPSQQKRNLSGVFSK